MKPFLPALLCILLLPTLPLPGQTVTSVDQAQLFSDATSFKALCRLTIDDGTGDVKTRDLTIWSLRSGAEVRLLAQVTAPAALKNLKFLRVETKEGTGVWLKTSRGVQRLPAQGDPEPLFGSDFTTGDFQPGSPDWEARREAAEGTEVFERPTPPRLGWSRQVLTLRQEDRLVVKSEFFSASGALVRRYEVAAFQPDGTPARVVLEDLRAHRRSELTILSLDEAAKPAANLFTPGAL